MTVVERIRSTGPKKILALDGGGIRGMIAVEVLAAIENLLREKLKKALISCSQTTSTSWPVPAPLRSSRPAFWMGMKVETIRRFYINSGRDMFDKAFVFSSGFGT